MDTKRREELRRLVDGATPGPWGWRESGSGYVVSNVLGAVVWAFGSETSNGAVTGVVDDEGEANARFIAAARTALPELLAEVEALTKRAEKAEWENRQLHQNADAYMAARARAEKAEAELVRLGEEETRRSGRIIDFCAKALPLLGIDNSGWRLVDFDAVLLEIKAMTDRAKRAEAASAESTDGWAESEALQAELAIAKSAITLTPDEAKDVLAVLEMAAPIVGGASIGSAPAYERRQRVEDARDLLKAKVFGC